MTTVSYSGSYASDIDQRLLQLTAAAQNVSLSLTAADRTSLIQTSRHAFTGQVTEHVGVTLVSSLQLLWPSEAAAEPQVKSWLESTDLTVLYLLRTKPDDKIGTERTNGHVNEGMVFPLIHGLTFVLFDSYAFVPCLFSHSRPTLEGCASTR